MTKGEIIPTNTKDGCEPFKRLFKKHSICHIYFRYIRYHNKIFHYREYDLDKEQSKLANLDELKM